MPTYNKHIGKMSAEVMIQIFASPLTVCDNPNSSAYEPTLRQYAGTLGASGATALWARSEKSEYQKRKPNKV
jgi:hypothetical protein